MVSMVFMHTGCESKPVSVDLGEHGYQITAFNTYVDTTRSIKDQSSPGVSSRLYLGTIDSTFNSSIFIRLNNDVLNSHSDICELPADSIQYNSTYISLKSISHFSNISTRSENKQNHADQQENFNDQPDLYKVHAYWMDMREFGLDWDESSNFSFTTDNTVIFGNTEVDLSQLNTNPHATELKVVYINSGIKVYFTPIEDVSGNSGLLEALCDVTSGNDYGILLRYDAPDDLIEFYASNHTSLSAQPFVTVKYEKYLTTLDPVNKFVIQDIIPVAFHPNGFTAVTDTILDNWGSIVAMNFDPTNPQWSNIPIPDTLLSQIGFIDSTFELMKFQIKPIIHDADSSGAIIFYLSDIILASSDFDPHDDNYPEVETGTENNLQFDNGELFFDCGEDAICNDEEPGYQPFGTEGNFQWDEEELFTDSGPDSLFSWEEAGYDPLTNPDPAGDDFNDDPSGDNWRDCGVDRLCESDPGYTGPDEGESNGVWDPGEGLESNGQYDENELFWDYGLDGVPDINEPGYDAIFNPDPANDNWSELNPSGTEGNGVFDWVDQNNNGIQDMEDLLEVFKDAGQDSLWSYAEPGYNPYGKEGNGQYDLNEPFEDCGTDQICDGDPLEDPEGDDYVPDPAGDDYSTISLTGTEGNGILDWIDLNGNGLWDSGEGEQWFDWGIDMIKNESEPYYGGRRLQLSPSILYTTWNFPEETEAQFEGSVINTNNGDEAAIWVSSVAPEPGTELYNVTISIHSTLPVNGVQFRLNHVPFQFSQTQFGVVNTSIWQIDSNKIIDDISLYPSDQYSESVLSSQNLVNYGFNLKTYLDFYELQEFIAENPEAIISKAYLHLWADTTQSDIQGNMVLTLNRLTDFISLPVDSLPMEAIISSNLNSLSATGEITIDIKSHIQNLVYGVYQDYGYILEGNHNSFNFSMLNILNPSQSDSLKTKLEILYSK